MQKIMVALPTRGIIDTLTIKSILSNAKGSRIEFTYDLPLPDSRIELTNRFLDSDCDYIWWVDDDMVIPDGFLDKLLEVADENTVATGAYYMQNGKKSVYYRGQEEASQCGFGCVLIHRNIYLNTPKPWYQVTKKHIRQGDSSRWIDDPKSAWGGEDIWFWHQAIDIAGFKMKEVGDVGHLRIRTWGSKYLNNGVHDIYQLDENGQEGFQLQMNADEYHKVETDYINRQLEGMKNGLRATSRTKPTKE